MANFLGNFVSLMGFPVFYFQNLLTLASDVLVLFQLKEVLPYCQLSEGQCILFSVYDREFIP
jgi:hypothetical protein